MFFIANIVYCTKTTPNNITYSMWFVCQMNGTSPSGIFPRGKIPKLGWCAISVSDMSYGSFIKETGNISCGEFTMIKKTTSEWIRTRLLHISDSSNNGSILSRLCWDLRWNCTLVTWCLPCACRTLSSTEELKQRAPEVRGGENVEKKVDTVIDQREKPTESEDDLLGQDIWKN